MQNTSRAALQSSQSCMGLSLHVSWSHVYTDWRCIILMQTPSDHLPINALSRPSDGVQYVPAEEDICTAPKCKCHALAFSLGSKLPPKQLLYTAAWHAQTSKVASSFANQCLAYGLLAARTICGREYGVHCFSATNSYVLCICNAGGFARPA